MMQTVRLEIILAAYLMGAIPFGFLIGITRGHNLLREGSGNIGSTNAKRVLGTFWGITILLLDVSKAFFPTYLSMRFLGYDHSAATTLGAFVVFGHCYSVFLGFRGGKGVACLLGVSLAVNPIIAIGAWVISKVVKKITRYVSVSSMAGVVALAFAMWFTPSFTLGRWTFPSLSLEAKIAFLLLAILVIYRHKENIARIKTGDEPKVFKADVVGGFALCAEDSRPAYYREKLGKKFLPWMPEKMLLKLLTDERIEWLKAHVPIITMGKVNVTSSAENGRNVTMKFVATTKTAEELTTMKDGYLCITELVLSKIKKIKFWGLGGFTSIVTEGGNKVAKAVEQFGCYVTSGNSLTALSSFDVLITLAKRCMYILQNCTVAILGGRGSMGKVLAKMFSPLVKEVILVGRPGTDLSDTVLELQGQGFLNVSWEPELKLALGKSILVVSVASTTQDLKIDPDWFLKGAIVVDTSRPRSMGVKLAERPDIIVVAGGLWRLPKGGFSTFNFGLHFTEVLACMAETIIWMLEGREHEHHSLGTEMDYDEVVEIGALAKKHGFTSPRLRGTDDKPIKVERLLAFFKAIGLNPVDAAKAATELTAVPE